MPGRPRNGLLHWILAPTRYVSRAQCCAPTALVGRVLRQREMRPVTPCWWERPFAFGLAGMTVALPLLMVQTIATAEATPPHSLQVRGVASP